MQCVHALPPPRFNYQGRLTDSAGIALGGIHTIHFSLYQGGGTATANAGVLVYQESAALAISDGIVNHAVGTGVATVGGPLSATALDSASNVFLQVAVDTVGNVILPRTRLEPVPYAVHALSDESVPAGSSILTPTSAPPTDYTYTGHALSTPGLWSSVAAMTKRTQVAGAAVSGKFYAIGGNDQGAKDFCEEYNPGTNAWTPKTPMTTPRFSCATAVYNNRIYVFGGTIDNFTGLSVVEMFDPVTNTWTPRANMPSPRYGAAAATVNGKIYVIAGLHNSTPVNFNQEYDPETNSWGPAKAVIPTQRGFSAGAALGGKIYVLGGFAAGNYLATNEAYDPVANTWSAKAPMTTARVNFPAVALNGRIYAISGTNGNPALALTSTEEYNPATGLWTQKAHHPLGRVGMAGGAIGGRIYVAGGAANNVIYGTAERFDPGVFFIHQKD